MRECLSVQIFRLIAIVMLDLFNEVTASLVPFEFCEFATARHFLYLILVIRVL